MDVLINYCIIIAAVCSAFTIGIGVPIILIAYIMKQLGLN